MASIVYLDVDDEITSAAARIRSGDERRVVLVVPYGSRLATSRINFRLLAREAQTRGRRLWIVAADAATRALAASAGLAVFGSVAEYEDTLETAARPTDGDGTGLGVPAERPSRARREPRAVASADGAPEGAEDAAAPEDLEDAAAILATTTAAGAAAAAPSGAPPLGAGSVIPPEVPFTTPTARRKKPSLPVIGAAPPWSLPRVPAPAAVGLLVLALIVSVVAAFLFLPSASIVVTAHPEPVTPLQLTVRADPDATAPDPAKALVPAQRLNITVQTSGTFETKGKRVEEAAATGQVTFQSYDTGSTNPIPGGSIVSTEGGVQFRTTKAVTIPRANIIFPRVFPGEAKVDVQAVKKGVEGNVPANAITVVPNGEDPNLTKVRNEDQTTGGKHNQFPVVKKADIQAATDALQAKLGTEFDKALADPSRVPEGLTLYPETKKLGTGTPTVDPSTLLDKEIASFDLGTTATGTVTAVDTNAVNALAQSAISGNVAADHRLVDGSVVVSVEEPSVEGETVSFLVRATAQQVRVLDSKTLLAQIKGKSVPQARAILEQYGEVQISVWPAWVSSIPTIDARLDLRAETTSKPLEPDGSSPPGPGGQGSSPASKPSPGANAGSSGSAAP
jgi:hypothetical protein